MREETPRGGVFFFFFLGGGGGATFLGRVFGLRV